MLCLSFYEWRCIDAGEQMILAPFLGKTSRDRAPGRFADFLFAPKHEKADVLLTTNMGPVRRLQPERQIEILEHNSSFSHDAVLPWNAL